jgi:hypothetical protein
MVSQDATGQPVQRATRQSEIWDEIKTGLLFKGHQES